MLRLQRAVRRAYLRYQINSTTHEARLCLRDERVARDNRSMHALSGLYARLTGVDTARLRAAPVHRKQMPLLLVRR